MYRAAFCLCVLLAASARGDYIQFRNGGKIEGVITGETATDITIKTGPGNATFKKSQLASIYRDPPEANARRTENWRAENWSEPEFLPAALRQLSTDLRALGGKRAAALDAQRKFAQLRAIAANDETEYARLQEKRAAIVLKQPDLRDRDAVAAYNRLVETSNDLVNRMNAIGQRGSQLDTAEKSARTSFSTYITALNKLRDDLNAASARPQPDKQGKHFLEKAAQQIATYSAEMQEAKIAVTDPRTRHAVVTARFNDRHDAKLLVDTGATYVSIPASTAARLNIEWDKKKKSKATLADGSEINVYPITIRRLTVAGATIENVPAVVMPDATGTAEAEGLLGMSFLREFDIQIDYATGAISLRRLPPPK